MVYVLLAGIHSRFVLNAAIFSFNEPILFPVSLIERFEAFILVSTSAHFPSILSLLMLTVYNAGEILS